MLDLNSIFETLRAMPTPEGGMMLACPITGFEQHHLARDVQGAPLVLISTVQSQTRTRTTPLKLEHLTVQHDVECRVSNVNGVVQEGRYTVIACVDADRVLQTYFLRIMGTLIASLGANPASSDVTRAVYRLAELFRVLVAAPLKSVQGLWAELFMIARSPNASVLVEAWHTTPEDRYDFNQASQRIEVKSGAGRLRTHQFSLEQLHPPEGTTVLVASLFVEKAGAGTSLANLLDQVRLRISDNLDLLMQLDKVVGMTMGSSWRHAMNERFDYELARQSLAFYETASIPTISPQLPPDVSNVHFTSDLSRIEAAELSIHRLAGGLFEATL